MSAVQKLQIDGQRCIGCQACTHACPAGLISFFDKEGWRTLQLPMTCSEECVRCADACSETALRLEPTDSARREHQSLQFALKRCTACGAAYVTDKMADKLRTSVSSLLIPPDQDWMALCLECRRTAEAGQIARRGLMRRSF
jgi:ferredoxin